MSGADLGTWERVLLARHQDGHLRPRMAILTLGSGSWTPRIGKANLATLDADPDDHCAHMIAWVCRVP
jgi:hypothetical protein